MAAAEEEGEMLCVSEIAPACIPSIKADAIVGKREQQSGILQQDNVAAK